jgi:hypothetical protein
MRYDVEFEKELEKRALGLSNDIVSTIAEVAFEVAEPYHDNIKWTTETIAITRQDGIADFIYIGDKVVRLPWRYVLPILLKDYGRVIFIDARKVVRKDKVVEALKEKLNQVKEELSRLARKKGKQAMVMRTVLERDLERILKTLNYLEA